MTSWPLCARYHALVVPITPAPRTITLMPASDKKAKGGKLALYPPGNESTLLTFARQASPSAASMHCAEAVQQVVRWIYRSSPMRHHRVCMRAGTERIAYFPV